MRVDNADFDFEDDEPIKRQRVLPKGSFQAVSEWIRLGGRARRRGWPPGNYIRAVHSSEFMSRLDQPDVIHIWSYQQLPGRIRYLMPRVWEGAHKDILEMDWVKILPRPEHEEMVEERLRDGTIGGLVIYRLNC